ncbi:sulfotransferase [Acidocella sp.]|uniref:sulfotransferase family protein n=1 Tax=Acidocella sp. TaxID=50710 RepID=UPI002628264B|nr:sulfotransferase [Acidocella sp.]
MALTFDEIVTAAREKSAAPDPASDSWREGLEILLKDHAQTGSLSERGEGIIKNRYVEALAGRMQVDEFARHNPAVFQVPVKRPVFILGMPRTGTTVASYLMAADPANRSMLRWEAYQGGAPAAPGALKSDPRCLAELAKDEAMLKANPGIAAAHWEPGDGPTECVHLLAQDFRSLMLAVLAETPTYHDWILFTNMASAFAHRKRVLQALQSTNGGRWVLKMPSDALFIRQLFKTFPDAKVIWTHRDPYATFASSINMRGKSRPIFNKDAGLAYMRRFFPLQLALHVARPLEVAAERPGDIYNLYYDDMLADPLVQMKKIYAWLGDDWTGATQNGMETWLRENPQGRYGVHKYSLAEWGFTKQELEPYFSDYLRTHPVATAKEA